MLPQRIFTIGHSNRQIDDFIALLRQNSVSCVIDIRTVPKSRHNPQFGQDLLAASLHEAGIDYHYLRGLGGLRKPRPDSINGAWRNLSFRGYADYMQTDEFATGVDTVLALGTAQPCALMCAEAVPWRCHRSLVADALLVRGVAVDDIIDSRQARPHKLTPFAQVQGRCITYPLQPEALQHSAETAREP